MLVTFAAIAYLGKFLKRHRKAELCSEPLGQNLLMLESVSNDIMLKNAILKGYQTSLEID